MDRVTKQINQQYNDFVEFVNADPSQSNQKFREKLLEELQEANQELEQEMQSQPVIEKMRTFCNDPNSKRSQTPHGSVARMSREINQNAQAQDCSMLIQLEDTVWKYKHVNHQLQANIQVFNLQQTTSDTICRHLESQLQEVLDKLSNWSRSMTIKDLKIRLNLENKRLQELLREDFEARNKVKQQRFNKLESNQINLLNQNRLNSQEVEIQKNQITFAKVSLDDSERRIVEAVEDRELAEKRAREAEQRVRVLEAYLEDEGGDFTKAQGETKQTISELNELRSQYNRAMKERLYCQCY
ncbi:hypothetical protein PPACK8108_LOCUS22410 [Phakopsora pachyrhizi]|uniref:Uncharacterized protein n=1 Tax=Phakopsora pachyrhizi TaxID=170000 RepID=A0AAV0BJX8_PHAPC|nr:hypothetical protein PPACK8108_LOCUS22410 [Phakopsora pachyrhizi]